MSAETRQAELADPRRGPNRRLREMGILLIACDVAGELRCRPSRGDDWLSDLCYHAPLFRHALRETAQTWAPEGQPPLVEAMPGLWLVPMPVRMHRRRVGYAVAVLMTAKLLEAEQLAAMCQGARLDLQLVRSLLAALPPVAESDLQRLADMVCFLHETRERAETERQAAESIGKQLAESYEEINLLYTVIGTMTEVQQPERFVATACGELLHTLPYRWVGVVFSADRKILKQLAGRFVLAGDPQRPRQQLRGVLERLLETCDWTGARVVDDGPDADPTGLGDLGRAAIVYPVRRDDRLLGILIAADKQGEDSDASSVDMKLLGATATHMSIFLENAALYDDLNAMFLGTLEALTASIDAKDRYTCGHSLRVAHLTEQLARAAGESESVVQRMRIAGLVHDVGKIGVPERVLTKPGRLTDEEFAWIKRHPEIGHRILRDIPRFDDILPGVLHHHERWDGGGYPHNLAGEAIPLVGRIIALADAFDAMSSSRTYRQARCRPDVLSEIERCRDTQFDPRLVPLFLELAFDEYDRLAEEHHLAL